MYIENGDTLVVKSTFDFYTKERIGHKPNTWRYWDSADLLTKNMLNSITKIRVLNAGNQLCSFTRSVQDVSFFGDVVVVSWEHDNGTN